MLSALCVPPAGKGLSLVCETSSDVMAPPFTPALSSDSLLIGRNVSCDISAWWKEQSGYSSHTQGLMFDS